MSASSREKNNTKRNLVRSTTKSRARCRQSSNGFVSQCAMNNCVEERPNVETLLSEQDRSLEVLRAMFNGDRLMIIELSKYIEVRELTYRE